MNDQNEQKTKPFVRSNGRDEIETASLLSSPGLLSIP